MGAPRVYHCGRPTLTKQMCADMSEWHLITCEYPPQVGGVSDYTYLVGSELAAVGHKVHVWCPPSDGETPLAPGVTVHREFGHFSPADLRRVGRLLNEFPAPRRLFVQWVPHGFGYRSLNLAFCLWLWKRSKINKDFIDLMVHEPYLAFLEGSRKQDLAACVHRVMTIVMLNAARRVWVSIPAWVPRLQPYAFGRRLGFDWLPLPSTVPVVENTEFISKIRNHHTNDGQLLLAHFGPYIKQVSEPVSKLLYSLLGNYHNLSVLLLGKGGEAMRNQMIQTQPNLTNRIYATGLLSMEELSAHLSACDLIIQPYPDGVSSRRTSAMACLSHGLPMITTTGRLTEPLWEQSGAVALAPVGDIEMLKQLAERLIADKDERERLSVASAMLYQECFALDHTLAALQAA
jgi:glycosyltransferase involved in cell wall biosynthesis